MDFQRLEVKERPKNGIEDQKDRKLFFFLFTLMSFLELSRTKILSRCSKVLIKKSR